MNQAGSHFMCLAKTFNFLEKCLRAIAFMWPLTLMREDTIFAAFARRAEPISNFNLSILATIGEAFESLDEAI